MVMTGFREVSSSITGGCRFVDAGTPVTSFRPILTGKNKKGFLNKLDQPYGKK